MNKKIEYTVSQDEEGMWIYTFPVEIKYDAKNNDALSLLSDFIDDVITITRELNLTSNQELPYNDVIEAINISRKQFEEVREMTPEIATLVLYKLAEEVGM